MSKIKKYIIIAMVVFMGLLTIPAPVKAATRTVKKAKTTTTLSTANKVAVPVKKGTTKLKINRSGYICFTAPKKGKYSFKFYKWQKNTIGYAEFQKQTGNKLKDIKVKTYGGKESTLWMAGNKAVEGLNSADDKKKELYSTVRVATVKLNKGQKLFIYLSTETKKKSSVKLQITKGDKSSTIGYVGKISRTIQSDNPTTPAVNTRDVLLAHGVWDLYYGAKYPSTLHIKCAYYLPNQVNEKGENYDRVVVCGYAMNAFGGYGDIYTVELRVPNSSTWADRYEDNGYYYTPGYITNNEPGLSGTYIDSSIIKNAYESCYGDNAKTTIVYD